MKKQLFKFCFGISFIGAFFWACNNDDGSAEISREPFFEISALFSSENELLGIQEDSLKVAIKTNSYWEVKKGENSSWLSVTPNKGTGDNTVKISSTKNIGVGERSAWLFFNAYSLKDSLKVSQKGTDLLLSKTTFEEVSAVGATLSFTVESDKEWNSEKSETASWISLNTDKGSKGISEIEMVVAANEQPVSRKDSIMFTTTEAGTTSKIWLSVIQAEGKRVLVASTEAANVAVEGGTFKVNVESNISWEANSNIEGVVFDPNTGEGTKETTVTYPENNQKDARIIALLFTGKAPNDTVSRKLEIVQKGTSSLTDVISITPTSFKDVTVDGTVLNLSLSAKKPWKTSKTATATWLSVAPATGEIGDAEVKITVAKNTATEIRKDSILFVSKDDLPNSEVWVKVSQKAFVPVISSSSEVTEVKSGTGSFNVALNSNVAWNASSTLSGVIIEPKSGSASDKAQLISITYPENSSEEARKIDLAFTGKAPYDSFDNKLSINQKGTTPSAIVVREENINIDGRNQIFTIELSSSNVDWQVVSKDSRFVITENASGVATQSPVLIKVNSQENATLNSVAGTIEIQKADDASVNTIVTVDQGLHPQNDESSVYADPTKTAAEIGLDKGVPHPSVDGWNFWSAHEFTSNAIGFWNFNTKLGIKNAKYNEDMKVFENGTFKIKTRKLASPTVNQHGDPAEYETAPVYSKRHHQGGAKFVKFTTNMRVEVRYRHSGHTGFNEAVWFMGQSNYDGQAIPWPDCGEIDLMEAPFAKESHFSLHSKNFSATTGNAETAHVKLPDETRWNIYWVEILEDRIIGGINGHQFFEHIKGEGGNNDWPWDNPAGMMMIITPGIGGWTGVMPNMAAGEEAFMELDWVRVYANGNFDQSSQTGHDGKFY
ncbi:hypothetical protein HCG49_10105 [Arenibacter sp. 6A1]|uniref:BACON domain-containing protein n=1 Tax=Arenibacter sp. 6A1 TaxID=2720391 RepID=UPI0014481AF8|nr:BACON domain-containing carbohydrate-binding protein [Arenibacter sp. 6A1]NKI26914.1 hypothetical protein [Arenibacter sp. 6A1]